MNVRYTHLLPFFFMKILRIKWGKNWTAGSKSPGKDQNEMSKSQLRQSCIQLVKQKLIFLPLPQTILLYL